MIRGNRRKRFEEFSILVTIFLLRKKLKFAKKTDGQRGHRRSREGFSFEWA